MRKLMMFVLLAFCSTMISQPLSASVKDDLKGSWNYKVPDAPYEYSNGKLFFAEVDGVKTITIQLMSGTKLKAQNITIENGNITFSTWVEGGYVKFTGKLVDGKITGKVDTPQGVMDLTAEKQE